MDLLTVLAHEIGHLMGHHHDEDGVMQDTLAGGEREVPELLADDLSAWWDWQVRETSKRK